MKHTNGLLHRIARFRFQPGDRYVDSLEADRRDSVRSWMTSTTRTCNKHGDYFTHERFTQPACPRCGGLTERVFPTVS